MTDYVTITFDDDTLEKVDRLAEKLFEGKRSQAVRHMVRSYDEE